LKLLTLFDYLIDYSPNWLILGIGDVNIVNERNKIVNFEKLKRENEELREKLKGNDNVDNKMLELRAKNEVMADLLERIIGKK